MRYLVGDVTSPVRELKGLEKISVAPGECQTVRFTSPIQQLGFHGLDLVSKVEPGQFTAWITPDKLSGLEGSFVV